MLTSEQGVPAPAPPAGKSISSALLIDSVSLRTRLEALHERTQETPNFNPVFQLSLEMSRALEAGSASLADLARLVSELECESLQSRATRLVRVLAPLDEAGNREACCALASAATTFEELSMQWTSPMLHVVFTAHPTFLLTPAQSDAIAHGASNGDISKQAVCTTGNERPSITLAHEHREAMAAIAHAGNSSAHFQSLPRKWQTSRLNARQNTPMNKCKAMRRSRQTALSQSRPVTISY